MTERPVDELACDHATALPLPDGRVAPVSDWSSSDLAAVRRRAAGLIELNDTR